MYHIEISHYRNFLNIQKYELKQLYDNVISHCSSVSFQDWCNFAFNQTSKDVWTRRQYKSARAF